MGLTRTRFGVSAGALCVIAIALMFGATAFLVLVSIAAIVHELGHYLALRAMRVRVLSFRLDITGIVLIRERSATYLQEIIIAAAGPAASAALAILAAAAARMTGAGEIYRLSGMSLMFCLFNLLPAHPLDGGKILHSAISMRARTIMTAERILCITGCVVIFILLCTGAYLLIITRTNFTLLFTSLWLLIYSQLSLK